MYPGVIYLSIWAFDGVEYQGGVETGGRRGHWWATFWLISNSLVSYRWYDVKELEVPRSSNLNLNFSGAQQNVLC